MVNYIIYKTTNLLNGKIYIGLHVTKNIDEGYLGSGKELKKDIKIFGREAFEREILHFTDSKEEMVLIERNLVDKKFISREDTYNLVIGGCNGWGRFNSNEQRIMKAKIRKTRKLLESNGLTRGQNVYLKRTETLLKDNPNALLDIGKKSSDTQRRNGKNKGGGNPKASIIDVYDNNDELIVTCHGDFHKKMKELELPERVLIHSYQRDGERIYSKKNTPERLTSSIFKGFYAIKRDSS